MMFILRDRTGIVPDVIRSSIKASRPTPAYADPHGGTDYFVAADKETGNALEIQGHEIVWLRDGWYEVGAGGVAIWTDATFWEVRNTTFTVSEICPL